MKHPFWLLNIVLLASLFAVIGFVFFSQQRIPRIVSFKPQEPIKLPKKEEFKVNLSKIYGNDLFNTFQAPVVQPEKEIKKAIPQPPPPQPVKITLAPPPKFLEPLQVTLKGIMVSSDDVYNVALIQDKTGATKNYKIGDKIEDAQLIRVMRNKIMLIRSNGQQETLYMSQREAELDQRYISQQNWSILVKKVNETLYEIDPDEFVNYVKNLGQLIEIFNASTAYKDGLSIGCRIGQVAPKSLPLMMGFAPGDIITDVEGIPATDTQSRLAIYEKLIATPLESIITISILRNQNQLQYQYQLKKLKEPFATKTTVIPGILRSPQQIEEEKIRILKEKESFAPTYEQLRKDEKKVMLKHGSKASTRHKNVLSSRMQPDTPVSIYD